MNQAQPYDAPPPPQGLPYPLPSAYASTAPHVPQSHRAIAQAAVQPTPQQRLSAQEPPPALQCENLVKNYGSFPALGPVSFTVNSGRIVGLLGSNGSGKTTLIKTVTGLLTPSYGTTRVFGHLPGVASKALVSYLPERTYLSSWMKVSDALDYFESFFADFSRSHAIDMLSRLQVPLFAPISKLSKGTKEKVQLILVMARHAKLYLLDEPIAGVDPAARDYILDTIISNYNRSATLIISTHLISDIERVLDDYIFLSRGQVVSAGAVSAVYEAGWSSLDAYFREAFRC